MGAWASRLPCQPQGGGVKRCVARRAGRARFRPPPHQAAEARVAWAGCAFGSDAGLGVRDDGGRVDPVSAAPARGDGMARPPGRRAVCRSSGGGATDAGRASVGATRTRPPRLAPERGRAQPGLPRRDWSGGCRCDAGRPGPGGDAVRGGGGRRRGTWSWQWPGIMWHLPPRIPRRCSGAACYSGPWQGKEATAVLPCGAPEAHPAAGPRTARWILVPCPRRARPRT